MRTELRALFLGAMVDEFTPTTVTEAKANGELCMNQNSRTLHLYTNGKWRWLPPAFSSAPRARGLTIGLGLSTRKQEREMYWRGVEPCQDEKVVNPLS